MAKRKMSRGNKEQPVQTPEPPKKVGVDKDVDKLKGSEKAVLTALRWFLDVVQKETLILLPGSTTKVLQEIMELNTTLNSCLKQEESSALSSRHNQVYQSLANLTFWADKIVLYGQSMMDKNQGSEVTSAVQNGIRELVKLSIEKLQLQDKTRAEGAASGTASAGSTPVSSTPAAAAAGLLRSQSPSPLTFDLQKGQGSQNLPSSSPASPHRSPKAHNNCNANRRPSDTAETVIEQRPLSPQEKEVLQRSPISPHGNMEFGGQLTSPSHAPPKPPLPAQRVIVTSNLSVPPLPPKTRKRNSQYDNTNVEDGSVTLRGVVTNNNNPNLSRSFSGSSMSVTSQLSDLSSTSTQSRPDSMHSLASTTTTEQSLDMSRLSMISGRSEGGAISPASGSERGYYYSSHYAKESFTFQHETRLINGGGRVVSDGGGVGGGESSGGDSTPPPTLPAKVKPRTERQLSAYDNLKPDDADALLQKLAQDVFVSEAPQPDVVDCTKPKSMATFMACGDIALRQECDGPPPLPPKTNKHVNTYLDLVGGYNTDGVELSFQSASISTHMLTYHGVGGNTHASPYEYMQRREEFFQESYHLQGPGGTVESRGYAHHQHHHHHERLEMGGGGSSGSCSSGSGGGGQGYDKGYETASLGYETMSQGSHDSDDMPPAIPPKKKDSLTHGPEALRSRHYTNPERSLSPMYDLKKKSESMIENGSQQHPHNGGGATIPAMVRLPSEAESEPEERFSKDGILDMLDVEELLSWSKDEEDNPVKGGPVEALIVHAADADRKDLVYYEAFLTTYRMFISSTDLLNKLLYRYKKFRHKTDMKSRRANRNAFFLLLRVAGDLIGQVEDDILKMLMELVFQLLCDGELMLAKILRDKVLTKIENNKKALTTNSKLLWDVGISMVRPSINEITSQEIAEQMTILDSELFQKIEIPEVLMWAKEQNEELSPNLTIFTEHFNKMSYWVRSLILQENKAQDREKYYIKFIKVMKHLRKLNNFNSYLAVLSALDSAPVRRLEWQRQTVESLKEYCTLIDSSSSFRCYRAALAEAEPPCIPYLGLILQDITFVHIGNPEELPDNGGVNFVKCWQYFSILDSMRRFKQHHYDTLKKDERVLAVFNDFSEYLDEEAMWQLSKVIKP